MSWWINGEATEFKSHWTSMQCFFGCDWFLMQFYLWYFPPPPVAFFPSVLHLLLHLRANADLQMTMTNLNKNVWRTRRIQKNFNIKPVNIALSTTKQKCSHPSAHSHITESCNVSVWLLFHIVNYHRPIYLSTEGLGPYAVLYWTLCTVIVQPYIDRTHLCIQ